MSFEIGTQVRFTFSVEKLSNPTFQEVDGSIGMITDTYTRDYLPDVTFYEVKLKDPVKVDGVEISEVEGVTDEDLELENLAEKVNPKYLTKNAKAMKDEIKKHAHKDSKDASAYNSHPNGGWKADYDKSGKPYKTKESGHTKKFKEMFGESAVNESEVDKALSNKAEKTGISKGILKKVYNRGLAAWRTGHRPGVSQHQWAMARVNSFATKGKGTWGKADKDLAKKVKQTNEAIKMDSEGKYNWDREDNIFSKKFRFLNIDISDAPKSLPPQVAEYLDQKYPDRRRLVDLGLAKGFAIEDIRCDNADIVYTIEPVYSTAGLERVEVTILRIFLKFDLEVWDLDEDDLIDVDPIEIIDDRYLNDTEKIKYTITPSFPLEIESIEVYMENSWDTKNISYEIGIGTNG